MKSLFFSLLFTPFLATQASAGILGDGAAWWLGHSSVIKLCYGDTSQESWVKQRTSSKLIAFSDENRALITSTLETEFTPELTGITFKIVGSCNDANKDQIDAVLFLGLDNSTNYDAVTGETRFPKAEDKNPYKPFVRIDLFQPPEWRMSFPSSVIRYPLSKDQQLRLIVLHEFGHLAGLAHEHTRTEALTDKHCELLPKGVLQPGSGYGLVGFGKQPGGTDYYDLTSVMNYCWEMYLREEAKEDLVHLSKGDQTTLLHLYQNRPTEK